MFVEELTESLLIARKTFRRTKPGCATRRPRRGRLAMIC